MASENLFSPREQPEKVVLLIEDSSMDVMLLCELLRRHGSFKVETAGTIHAAMERLRDGGIDIILSDLNLPDSTAEETITTLLSHSPSVPVVVLSG